MQVLLQPVYDITPTIVCFNNEPEANKDFDGIVTNGTYTGPNFTPHTPINSIRK